MSRRTLALCMALAGCAGDPSGGDAGGVDAAASDAGRGADGSAPDDGAASGDDASAREDAGRAERIPPCAAGPPGALTYEEYAAAAHDAICALHARCGDGVAPWIEIGAVCRDDLDDPAPTWLAAGTACFEPEVAERCLALLSGDCYAIGVAFLQTCLEVVRPMLDEGDACVDAAECLSGRCVRAGATCDGTCAPGGGPGDPCGGALQCGPGLGCPDGTCQPYRAEGEGCQTYLDCQPGLQCSGGSCVPLGGELARCDSGLECEPTLYCHFPPDGACRSRPTEGEICSEDQCAAGFMCLGRACRRAFGPGEACTSDESCPATFGCDVDDGCVQLPRVGETCTPERGCGEGECVEGTCQLRPEGAPCSSDSQCAGDCDVDVVFGSECIGPRLRGEECVDSRICDHGLVCRGGVCDDPCPRAR